ncbi:MAG: efflux RND transporter periplasmic adaptor subunit [Piscinibacter sp.]|uniref:efflux RND transporter periplasmic adaptor subunit n=1 Tax=Piscinibacter sp. TaxID=1903157 RepID=UPI002583BD99|nr:efflux RND transporter periplasmic adaptor subunit [Piscinibacter sp.]MCW5665349.1 efflux RND transporter periplasmic adaptor subunit [Piscinibacter sp.]
MPPVAVSPRSSIRFQLALVLAAGGAWLLSGCGPSQAQGGPPMAPPVSAAPAVQKNVQLFEEFSGRIEAVETVEVRARVAGTIERVHFRDGQEVKKGDLLFTIDPRPFTTELARAEAQLAAARSAAGLAQTEQARTAKLLEQKAVSQQEADQADASLRNAQAAARAAEAAVASARLNVEYARIRAPIAGKASRANVTAGNLVGVGDPVLTTLVAQDKVHAWFDVSEQAYLRARAAAGKGAPKVELGLSDETGYPHAGSVDFVDNRLNPATGAIRMRAVLDNKDRRFVPGLFARVRLANGGSGNVVLIPDRAIGTDQSKRFVFVVGDDKVAQFREVKLGALLEGMRVITGGLKPGELVVVNGLQRVRPGAPLAPQVLAVDEHGMPVEPPPGAPPGAAPASAPNKS